jgi:hypothetical protein
VVLDFGGLRSAMDRSRALYKEARRALSKVRYCHSALAHRVQLCAAHWNF